MRALSFLLALISPFVCFAGGYDLGNGGSVVVCSENAAPSHFKVFKTNAVVVDLLAGQRRHEATYRRLMSLRNADLRAAFPKALSMFMNDQAELRALFMNWFTKETFTLVDRAPFSVSVAGTFAVPFGCRKVQAAVHYVWVPTSSSLSRIYFTRAIWNTLPTDQKVALLLHEYVLRATVSHFGFMAQGRSIEAVGVMMSDRGRTADGKNWVEVLNDHWVENCNGSGC